MGIVISFEEARKRLAGARTESRSIFIDGGKYDAFLLAALEPDPFTGFATADQVKVALGVHFDIWPDRIAG